jgi:hypothetical protein
MAIKKKIVLSIKLTGPASQVYKTLADMYSNIQYDKLAVVVEKLNESLFLSESERARQELEKLNKDFIAAHVTKDNE